MEAFSQEISCKTLSGLGPMILLKSNFPEFSTFCALKIELQHLSWCQTTSTSVACSILENKESVLIFFDNICEKKKKCLVLYLYFLFILHYGQQITQVCFSLISVDSDYHNAVFVYVYGQRIAP